MTRISFWDPQTVHEWDPYYNLVRFLRTIALKDRIPPSDYKVWAQDRYLELEEIDISSVSELLQSILTVNKRLREKYFQPFLDLFSIGCIWTWDPTEGVSNQHWIVYSIVYL